MIAVAKAPIYVLQITLEWSEPLVTRRVKVKSDISLEVLHYVIQDAMGWEEDHMHQFIVGKTYYGAPDNLGSDVLDEQDFTLRDVAPKKGSKLKYEYDFGDSWIHLIKVEQVVKDDPEYKHPECLSGENACPPDDSGGVGGYANMLEILQDPTHEEYEEVLEWLGPEFDPTMFDLKQANEALAQIKE